MAKFQCPRKSQGPKFQKVYEASETAKLTEASFEIWSLCIHLDIAAGH